MRLGFVGDERVVAWKDGLQLVDVAHGAPVDVPLEPDQIVDAACGAAHVWVAARATTGAMRLHRVRGDGALEPLTIDLHPADGRLRASTFHDCAVWIGDASSILTVSADGLSCTALDEPADFVVPFSPTRWAVARAGVVLLKTGTQTRWSATLAGQVEDGAFLFDGSDLGLVVSTPESRTIVVLGGRDGAVRHRIRLDANAVVRFAARRGHALVQLPGSRLLLLDLRFARAIFEYTYPEPIVATALDDSGTRIAIAVGSSARPSLDWVLTRDLIAHASRPSVATTLPEPPPVAEPEAAPVHAPAEETSAAPASFDVTDPPALRPRMRRHRMEPARARELLERYRAVIVARCYQATAREWDDGRIVWESQNEHPFETELMGLLARQHGRASKHVQEAASTVASARAALTELERSVSDTLAPLDEIASELELSALARELLLLIAAPTIWGEVARLYGIVANDSDRGVVDEMLLRQVLGAEFDPHEIARELDPDRPLIQRGAVRVGAGAMRPFLSLQADPLVVKQLRGDDVGEAVGGELQIVSADRSVDRLFLPDGVTARLVEVLQRPSTAPFRLVLRGRVGTGRTAVIAAVAETANRRVAMLDAAPLIRDGQVRVGELRLGIQRAALGGWLPCVDNLDIIGRDDRAAHEQLREVFRSHAGPLALRLGADVPPPLDPGYHVIDLAQLPETRRYEVWVSELAARGLVLPDVRELAARWEIGPGTVCKVLDQLQALGPAEPAQLHVRLDAIIHQHLANRVGELANRVTRLARWSQIVLPTDVLDSLLELVSRVRNRHVVFERWGFERVMHTSSGLTALFQGGPGTGKTMVATAIAADLGVDLYRVDVSRVISKWIGETERNLSQLFDAAEDGQAMLLFDEADSLFAKRTEVKSSVDRYSNLEVNYLLQRLDSFSGIAILTTNFGGAIDPAFKRRLSFRLTFPFPDEEMREQLWRTHIPDAVPRAGSLDLATLARKYTMSGGYIRNAALRAGFLAAAEGAALRHEHLERAVQLEFREIGKLAESGLLE